VQQQHLLVNQEVLERELDEFLDIPDEVVTEVSEVDKTTGASRTLTLAASKAHYKIQDGVANPVETTSPLYLLSLPMAPLGPTAPTARAQVEFHFAENEICCISFLQYKAHKIATGRAKPGPIPHDRDCRNKRHRRMKPKASITI
jgi:hypothetical protein